MTALSTSTVVQALRRAAVRATLAPSVHNTQPWSFVLLGESLEIHADPARRLPVLDPTGRQMHISCGCALFNARASLAGSGFHALVERAPDPTRPGLLATVTVGPPTTGQPLAGIGALAASIGSRRTNRRRFVDESVPAGIVDILVAAAAAEGGELMPITRPHDRLIVAAESQRADAQENADPAYRAELRRWTSTDPSRDDGVPSSAIPGRAHDGQDDLDTDDFGTRDFGTRDFGTRPFDTRPFDTGRAGELPTETRSGLDQCLLLLGTAADTPAAWLRCGEALEHTLLEIARHGYAVSPLTQVIEMANTRAMLRHELGLVMQPHVLLRVGHAPTTPATRRRRLVDMFTDAA